MNPIIVIINLKLNKKIVCSAINMILHKIRAMAVGNKQYPKTQILWKKDLQQTYYFLNIINKMQNSCIIYFLYFRLKKFIIISY